MSAILFCQKNQRGIFLCKLLISIDKKRSSSKKNTHQDFLKNLLGTFKNYFSGKLKPYKKHSLL